MQKYRRKKFLPSFIIVVFIFLWYSNTRIIGGDEMSNITDEKQEKNETLKLVYKIYHFIAKIFLYSILII